LSNLLVRGSGGVNGDELAQPVSCEIDAEDGKINIQVETADPNSSIIPPYTIQWHRQAPTNTAYEQKLLLQGVQAGDSLENYTIRLNQIPITYITKIENEPRESVVNELTQQIDISNQFEARVNPENTDEIIIRTESLALLEMEIISSNTKLQLIKSTSNIATWVPLDGTNGNPNYTGFLDLNDLAEGLYRYTITTTNLTQCDNGAVPNSIQDVIIVENENILEIREGPIIDEYLCNGQSGTLFLDIFDGDTGPLTFFYNGFPVSFEQVGTNQYLINIDSPEEIANLEIYNSANCGLSREINIGNGNPLFDYTSTNFQQNETFLAREDITFTDNSENEYDTFEFIFGDGTKSELINRNTPEPITHEYAISGTYYVTLRIYNDLGCAEELTKTIKIGKGYSILLPNVFTPNGDIWNSNFRPIFNGLSEITLRIYDSQGGIVYQEDGVEGENGLVLEGWNGNVELSSASGFGYTEDQSSGSDTNTQLPSSPYFIYTITGRTIDDESVFRDGTFILLQ
jgi:PKD repeat protein